MSRRRPPSFAILQSHPRHKAIHYLLLPRLVERDGELVALYVDYVAVAEFLVEDAVAEREGGNRAGRFCHQLAFDGQRQSADAGA